MAVERDKNIKLREFLARLEANMNFIAIQELKRRHSQQIIANLAEIINGKARDYWLLEDRFQALKNWFGIEGHRLMDLGLDENGLRKIASELEKLKGYSMSRWYRESESKNNHLRQQLDSAIRLAHNYVRDAANQLNLEFTPMGLMKSNRRPVDSTPISKIINSDRREYIKWLEHQLEILNDLYDPGASLAEILASEIKNMRRQGDVRDKMLVSNILHYFKINKDEIRSVREPNCTPNDMKTK